MGLTFPDCNIKKQESCSCISYGFEKQPENNCSEQAVADPDNSRCNTPEVKVNSFQFSAHVLT